MNSKNKKKLCLQLMQMQCIKFGEFELKSGIKSPFYIDLRNLVSFPKTMNFLAGLLFEKTKNLKFDRIAGIPYAGIPIATAFCIKSNKPMIYSRKEKKEHGTKKQIEGIFSKNETILVIDDIVSDGESKIEAIQTLQENGLIVKDILVTVDREHGAKNFLKKKRFTLHSLITMTEILEILEKNKKIDKKTIQACKEFIKKQKIIKK